MIHLHKQTGEVIYSDLLKATLKVSRMQSTKTKVENKLTHERVENKSQQKNIKKIQGYLLTTESETNKGQASQKLLVDKESTIQLWKKKLKIPATQLIQALELIELEKENDTLNNELNDYKYKILNFVEEKKEWEKDNFLLIENEKVLKQNHGVLEKEIEERKKEPEVQIIPPAAQTNQESIVSVNIKLLVLIILLFNLINCQEDKYANKS